LWKREGEGFVFVTSPEESDARPITDSVVREKYRSAMRIKRSQGDWETILEYVIHPDAEGSMPNWTHESIFGGRVYPL